MSGFIFKGRRFDYWDSPNQPPSERRVEIPLARHVLSTWSPEETIEVGAVMCYQLPLLTGRPCPHKTVDLYDPDPRIEHIDACSLEYKGRNVCSVSTLEHFGLADYGAADLNPHKGINCLKRIVEQAKEYFITIPVGYNPTLDIYIKELALPRSMLKQEYDGVWTELEHEDWSIQYRNPFKYANAVVILTNAACFKADRSGNGLNHNEDSSSSCSVGIFIVAHGGQSDPVEIRGRSQLVFDALLPIWKEHNIPIEIITNEADPIQTDLRSHAICTRGGPQVERGACTRILNIAARTGREYSIITHYDAILLPGLLTLIRKALVGNMQYLPNPAHRCARYPSQPMIWHRSALLKAIATADEHREILEAGFDDRFFAALCDQAAIPMVDHQPIGWVAPMANATPETNADMIAAVMRGALAFHGIKSKNALNTLLAARTQYCLRHV